MTNCLKMLEQRHNNFTVDSLTSKVHVNNITANVNVVKIHFIKWACFDESEESSKSTLS